MQTTTNNRPNPDDSALPLGHRMSLVILVSLLAMLSVDTATAAEDATDTAMLATSLGDNGEETPFIVLDDEPDADWFDGQPNRLGFDGARRAVNDEVKTKMQPWTGRPVELFDQEDNRCSGEIVAITGLSLSSPSFLEKRAFEQTVDDTLEDDNQRLDEPQMAHNLWDRGTPTVAGEVEITDDDCEISEIFWGAPGKREVTIMEPIDVTEDERRELTRQFRNSDGYESVQQRYEDWDLEHEPTWSLHDGASPTIEAFHSVEHGRTFAIVQATAGDGCGFFRGEFWKIYEMVDFRGGVRLQPIERPDGLPHDFQTVTMAATLQTGEPILVARDHIYGSMSTSRYVAQWLEEGTDTDRITHVPGDFECGC